MSVKHLWGDAGPTTTRGQTGSMDAEVPTVLICTTTRSGAHTTASTQRKLDRHAPLHAACATAIEQAEEEGVSSDTEEGRSDALAEEQLGRLTPWLQRAQITRADATSPSAQVAARAKFTRSRRTGILRTLGEDLEISTAAVAHAGVSLTIGSARAELTGSTAVR